MPTKMKPTALKLLHGRPGHHPLPADEAPGVGELWTAPAWFDDEQRAQWDYAIAHAPPGLLTGSDRDTLIVWCVAAVEYARAVQEVRRGGQIIKTKTGIPYQNPALGIMNRQALLMLKAGGELGFSPSARASLGSRAPELNANGPIRQPSRLTAYLERKPDRHDA